MGLAGAPYLLMLGMNSHGIGNVSNSVHSTDNRIGVPNVFVRRSTLEARTLEEARERGLLAARARGTNQFFADTGGRLWDLETSATAHALMDHTAVGFMAHSNHYVSPEMQALRGIRRRGVRGAAHHGRAAAGRGPGRRRGPGGPRGPSAAHPRAVAGGVHLRPPGARACRRATRA